MWPHMYGFSGWWLVMLLWMLLFWGAVAAGIYLLYRTLSQRNTVNPASGTMAAETPRAILDRRLAAGEISPDDYDALRRKLDGG